MSWKAAGLQINHYLERWIFIWVLSAMAIGYVLHGVLAHLEGSIVALFACMTFVTALGTRIKQIGYVMRHPYTIVLAFFMIHVFMPLFAFSIAKLTLAHQSSYITGIVLGASIPVGVTSVMWTGLAEGDLPLALAIVSIDTLLSPLVIPLTVHAVVGKSVQIPFATLFWGLVWMVVIPTILGILINEWSKGKAKQVVQPIAGPASKIAMLLVVAINVAVVEPTIQHGSNFKMLLITLILVAGFGYLIGHFSGVAARLKPVTRIAMTYNVGMRNISAGITIATQYFGHDVSIPVVLAMLFQQPFATFVYWLYMRKTHDGTGKQPLHVA
ncbi:bile acid:sodium symporter family protein [Fodinisporobacter ferrooxydans]|uniref:Bile acid:sodium symporter family protein n=1 Tax=Fodinisporobacter ferrooxydans TaxID=2901836 RepID=A0ABY4CSG8_9BACL|nr:bile acid:sodium symporter family protein [Alicyclobacillaceae bacterium MYW30-H2]